MKAPGPEGEEERADPGWDQQVVTPPTGVEDGCHQCCGAREGQMRKRQLPR